MPSKPSPLPDRAATKLEALGQRIRAARKAAGLAAASVAEAAGMSRVTLTRIERGEPAVTMGAYLGAITALGLELHVVDPQSKLGSAVTAATPAGTPDAATQAIRLADYPQLAGVAWHVTGIDTLTADEARGIYERHWRYLDPAAIGPYEARLLERLGLADRLEAAVRV